VAGTPSGPAKWLAPFSGRVIRKPVEWSTVVVAPPVANLAEECWRLLDSLREGPEECFRRAAIESVSRSTIGEDIDEMPDFPDEGFGKWQTVHHAS
jgi:hypothetical protein